MSSNARSLYEAVAAVTGGRDPIRVTAEALALLRNDTLVRGDDILHAAAAYEVRKTKSRDSR
jgi:hypothetical protein